MFPKYFILCPQKCVSDYVHVFPRISGVELRRYVLPPTERLKDKFKDYGLTTLALGEHGKQQKKEDERQRSRSPLQFDRNIYAVQQQSHSAWRSFHCCCYGIAFKLLFGNEFKTNKFSSSSAAQVLKILTFQHLLQVNWGQFPKLEAHLFRVWALEISLVAWCVVWWQVHFLFNDPGFYSIASLGRSLYMPRWWRRRHDWRPEERGHPIPKIADTSHWYRNLTKLNEVLDIDNTWSYCQPRPWHHILSTPMKKVSYWQRVHLLRHLLD